jgi:putative transposase
MMISWFLLALRAFSGVARSRVSLSAENAILRQQLAVLQRGRSRPLLRPADRVLWIWLCRHWSRWRQALMLIQPATVLTWHREGYRRHWRRRSGGFSGRPLIPRPHISLIRRISSDHPEWGEDRIALELKAKLGVEHAPSTIRRYMIARKGDGAPASTTWRTFLAGHASELWTMDLTTQPLWNYSVRYVLVLMELRSRRVVHVAVTASPTLTWVKQQVREATPFGSVPRFLVHDNDGIFGQFGARRPGKTGRSYRSALDLWLGEILFIKGIPIPYGAPNAQAHIERFMGSLKRECLNHFIFLSEDHLRRTVVAYITYYNGGRPHQGIEGIPECGPGLPRAAPPATGRGTIKFVARPVLGGLHHDYRLAA